MLTGVRLDVYEWKSSQTWYEETLGWKTLRWQSNVPSDASVTVTLGAERDAAVGPCGPVAAGEPPVVHARYRYGCKPTKLAGVKAMVLGGEGGELADPDGVPIRRAAEVIAAAGAEPAGAVDCAGRGGRGEPFEAKAAGGPLSPTDAPSPAASGVSRSEAARRARESATFCESHARGGSRGAAPCAPQRTSCF